MEQREFKTVIKTLGGKKVKVVTPKLTEREISRRALNNSALIEEKFIRFGNRSVKALVPKPLSEQERRLVEKRLEKMLKKLVLRKMKQEALKLRKRRCT